MAQYFIINFKKERILKVKLHKFNSRKLVYYYGNEKVVELPEYKYNDESIRGVWVSNVVNIDTPIMENIESYQAYLKNMVEVIASYNMNLIIFQVRPANDAYYKSQLNPWSRFITGTEGKDPGFDVLQFVIDEAKKINPMDGCCGCDRRRFVFPAFRI